MIDEQIFIKTVVQNIINNLHNIRIDEIDLDTQCYPYIPNHYNILYKFKFRKCKFECKCSFGTYKLRMKRAGILHMFDDWFVTYCDDICELYKQINTKYEPYSKKKQREKADIKKYNALQNVAKVFGFTN